MFVACRTNIYNQTHIQRTRPRRKTVFFKTSLPVPIYCSLSKYRSRPFYHGKWPQNGRKLESLENKIQDILSSVWHSKTVIPLAFVGYERMIAVAGEFLFTPTSRWRSLTRTATLLKPRLILRKFQEKIEVKKTEEKWA